MCLWNAELDAMILQPESSHGAANQQQTGLFQVLLQPSTSSAQLARRSFISTEG